MNRKYTIQDFDEVVKRLRNAFNEVALTTDIIVGFPGETEEEFQTTYNYLKKVNFYKMHIFKYSPRKGTKAAVMLNQVDGKIKEERSNKLIQLSNKNQKLFLNKYIGKVVEVLFEQKEGEFMKGHTKNYLVVKTKNESIQNEIIKVKINKEQNLELLGNTMK